MCAWRRSWIRRVARAAQAIFPWPYVEGLTIAEATNELAFLATGAYGKPLPKQHGAPIRLAVPWKYGFKSIKSIVRFTFTDQRPKSFWENLQSSRIRLLGKRQSHGGASALEPGDRGADRDRPAPADSPVQRLWRIRRRPLQGPPTRAAVCLTIWSGVRLTIWSGSCPPDQMVRKKPGSRGARLKFCRRGKADNHLPEGNSCLQRLQIWEDGTTDCLQRPLTMRMRAAMHNAEARMPAMRLPHLE